MGCKFSGRTLVLVFVVFQICGLYCVVYETMKAVIHADNTQVYGQQDLSLFLILFNAVELAVMLTDTALIAASAVQYFSFKKILVLVVFGFNLGVVLPYNASGLYLFFTSAPPIGNLTKESFSIFAEAYDGIEPRLTPSLKEFQEDNCCCGLEGESILSMNSSGLCASLETCRLKEFEACDIKIPRKMRLLVLVASSIGAGCAIIAMAITPFIYAYFEKDRRLARAEKIGDWQKKTTRMIERRQWALKRIAVKENGKKNNNKSQKKSEKSEKSTQSSKSMKSSKSDKKINDDTSSSSRSSSK